MSLAKLIHRIVTDDPFFHQFLQDPQAVLESVGLMLDEQTLMVVTKILSSHPKVHELCVMAGSTIPYSQWEA
ncbi:MAG: hypothetical protein AAGF95_16830 [Chloroflexota bacterium]